MRHLHAIHLTIISITLTLICYSISQAQGDTTAQLDKVHLRDGSILVGKVKVIKTETVEFVERETNLAYELKKSEIQVIVLSSGKSISFPNVLAPLPDPLRQQAPPPVIIEKDSGPGAGVVILAAVGAIFLVLLLISAAAH